MKKQQIVLLSLLALAASITVGCGGGGTNFTKLPFYSNRQSDPSTPLFLMDLDGTHVTPLPYTLGEFNSPSISADLKTVALVAYPNVWIMNSDGTGKKQLTAYTDDQADSNSYIFYAKISPDGKKIIYSLWDGANEVYGAWVMNADGTGKKNLTSTLPQDMQGCYSGSFSDDSKKVVFACYASSVGGIYTADLDGANRKTVLPTTPGFFDTPMFSPDGKKILFTGLNLGASRSGSAFVQHKPAFGSARGGALARVAPDLSGSDGLFSINLDGSGGVSIVPGAREGEILDSSLYYTLYDSESGNYQIWKSNPDGSSAVKLSDGTADDLLYLSVD